MMERRLRAESDTRPLILLDPRGAAAEEDLDAAVRAAASLTVHLARAGGCALLLPGERRPVILEPTLGGWPHAHARLALIEGTMRPSLGALPGEETLEHEPVGPEPGLRQRGQCRGVGDHHTAMPVILPGSTPMRIICVLIAEGSLPKLTADTLCAARRTSRLLYRGLTTSNNAPPVLKIHLSSS